MKTKYAKAFVLLTFFFGASLVFLVRPYLLRRYVAESPRVLNEATGHIHEFNQHGTVVFLSSYDNFSLIGVTFAGVLLLITSGLLLRKWFYSP